MTTAISTNILASQTLLAVGRIGRRRADSGDMVFYLVIAAVLIGGVCLAIFIGSRFAHNWRSNSHQGLFHGLCKQHGIGMKSRMLLQKVGNEMGVKYPCQVLIDPQWLNKAATSPAFRPQADELSELSERLFQ